MTTTLDIIDTAVKIGLGSVITGVTVYFVAKRKQHHELKKDMLIDKNELLKECAFKLEKSSSTTSRTIYAIYHVFRTTDDESKELLTEQISELSDASNEATEAQAIAYLIGERDLANLIGSYLAKEQKIYRHYRINLLKYDVEFVNSKAAEASKIKDSILTKLGEVFESIHT